MTDRTDPWKPATDSPSGVIKRRRVRVRGTRALGSRPDGEADVDEPAARLIEQNGRAIGVEVSCVCGRKIYLQLDCAPPGPPAAAPAGLAATPAI